MEEGDSHCAQITGSWPGGGARNANGVNTIEPQTGSKWLVL